MAENLITSIRPIQCCSKFRVSVALPYFQESSELEEELRFIQSICEMAGSANSFEQMNTMMFSLSSYLQEHIKKRRIIEHFFFQTRIDLDEFNPARVAGELARLRARVLGKNGPSFG